MQSLDPTGMVMIQCECESYGWARAPHTVTIDRAQLASACCDNACLPSSHWTGRWKQVRACDSDDAFEIDRCYARGTAVPRSDI